MIYQKTVDQFAKMLKNLGAILESAEKYAALKKFDPDILTQARLAPDQFNFTRQIQITCDTAKLSAASWANIEAPNHPDTEKSLAELKDRITSTVSYLARFKNEDFKDAGQRKITRPRWEGKHLLGEEFMIEYAVPNFYFHLSTAYSILRNQGVDIGKKDYLGKMDYKN